MPELAVTNIVMSGAAFVSNTELSGPAFVALLAGLAVLLALQLWATGDAQAKRRRGWALAIWFTFPVGALVWLLYMRHRIERQSVP